MKKFGSLSSPEPAFDPHWYLQAYPDVARAGMDPWQHYCLHGRAEGRQPCRNRAKIYDYHLWRGLSGIMQIRLHRLMEADGSTQEVDYARWALARWYWCCGQSEQVVGLMAVLQQRPLLAPLNAGPFILCQEALLELGHIQKAGQVLQVTKQYRNVSTSFGQFIK